MLFRFRARARRGESVAKLSAVWRDRCPEIPVECAIRGPESRAEPLICPPAAGFAPAVGAGFRAPRTKKARPKPGLGRDAWSARRVAFAALRACGDPARVTIRACARKEPAGGFPADQGDHTCKTVELAPSVYQLKRGPTNHWASPSANFTSPLRPQFSLNFTFAPRRA